MRNHDLLLAVIVVTILLTSLTPFGFVFVANAQTGGHGLSDQGSDVTSSTHGINVSDVLSSSGSSSGPSLEHHPATGVVALDSTSTGGHSVAASNYAKLLASQVHQLAPHGLAFLVGYSRADNSDPLDNDVRAEVYHVIRHTPGVYVQELADRTGFARSTVRYHLRVLTREHLVTREKVHGRVRYFPIGTDETKLSAALSNEATSTILFAVGELEPVTVSDVAEEIDRAPSTVSYHLSRLADDNLVDRTRDGDSVLTSLTPEVRKSLDSRVEVMEAGEVASSSANS